MNTTEFFKNCANNHSFLLKEYLKDLFLLLLICVGLYLFKGFSALNIGSYSFLYLLFAIPFGWVIAAFLHKAGHGNVSKGLLNRLIGEFTGHFVGYGFHNFVLVHTLHHNHSDEEFDPVSPKEMSFMRFLISPIRYMIKHTKDYLRSVHGHNKNYETILQAQTFIFYCNLFLRQILWLLLLGPELYLFFYAPAVMSNIAILAHINYVCHRDFEDGSVEVFNMNHNLYYRVANFITLGGYYHKNHHLNLNLFDPRTYNRRDKRLLTVKPNILLNERKNIGHEFTSKLPANSPLMMRIKRYFDMDMVWGEAQTKKKASRTVTFVANYKNT